MAKSQVHKDKTGECRWRLRADNTEPIATSGEGYKDKSSCLAGVELVKKLAPEATVEDKAWPGEDREFADSRGSGGVGVAGGFAGTPSPALGRRLTRAAGAPVRCGRSGPSVRLLPARGPRPAVQAARFQPASSPARASCRSRRA